MPHKPYPEEPYIVLEDGQSITEEEVDECGPSSAPYLWNGKVYQYFLANKKDDIGYAARHENGSICTPSTDQYACINWRDTDTGIARDYNFYAGSTNGLNCEDVYFPSPPPPYQSLYPNFRKEVESVGGQMNYLEWKNAAIKETIEPFGEFWGIPIVTPEGKRLFYQIRSYPEKSQAVRIITKQQFSSIHVFNPVVQVSPKLAPVPLLPLGILSSMILLSSGGAVVNAASIMQRQRRRLRRNE